MSRLLFIDLTANHNPHLINERPTGGTLTSLTRVPEALAKLGHEVYVKSGYEPKEPIEVINGVNYIAKETQIPKWDITIFNRNVLPKEFIQYCKTQGSKIIWWLHDIVDPRYLTDDAFTMVDHIVALSNYCVNTYTDFYLLNANKFSVIANGVDINIYNPGVYENRNPHMYITASALIKGYGPIQTTFENLKRHDPDIDFRIYSSQKLHGFENTESQIKFLDTMKSLGAHVYHPVSPIVLASILKKAWALLMPNSYPEICSNILLQARACGLPVVSSNIGANPEYLDKGGLITTKWHPHDVHSWIVEFTKQTVSLQHNKDLHKKLSEEAPIGVNSWDSIGEKWDELVKRLI